MSGKLKAFLLLMVMYGLGTVSGVAWQSYRMQHRPMRPLFMARHIRKLKKELHLSADQEQALQDIFKRAHDRATQINEEVSWDLADIHRDSIDAIHKVLTPEQAAAFDKLHRHSHRPSQPLADTRDNTVPVGISTPADAGVSS